MERLSQKLMHSWNAFRSQDVYDRNRSYGEYGTSFGRRPDQNRLPHYNDKTTLSSIFTRIAMDAAAVPMRHIRTDDEDRYLEDIKSGLNNILKVEANIDQGARDFRQDAVMTMLDTGCIALVPVETTLNPNLTGGYDILDMRVGTVVSWMPKHVKVNVYNEERGLREDIVLPKRMVAIVYNPLYAVMNESSSTLQRLIRKINLLDGVDEATASGKLDLIIQLPYVIKSEARRQAADQRRKDLESQLAGSKYGIGYTDGTEKITQLNRPAENNLLTQIEYLTEKLYGELGITAGVMLGTASQEEMNNYYNRTIEPILTAMVEAMRRTFLTKTARAQNQSVDFFQNPFKFVSMENMAEIADKFTRNEIVSSNEFRQFIRMKPSKDPKADELRNSNMPLPEPAAEPDGEAQAAMDDLTSTLDALMADLGGVEDDS